MANDTSTPSGRVAWYLKKLWLNSQTKMAGDTGLTQAAISKVVQGRRNPGRRFLLAVAAHPLVNAGWLLTGDGQPLTTADLGANSGELTLPISERLLGGPIDQWRSYLSPRRLAVTSHYFRDTRYFWVVNSNDFVQLNLLKDDVVLIETAPIWMEHSAQFSGHLCVVQRSSNLELTIAPLHDDPAQQPAVAAQPVRHRRSLIRKGPAGAIAKAVAAKAETAKPAPQPATRLETIVGLVVLQQREWALH